MSADLRHIDTWLFDLDDTLYPPEVGYLKLVEAKILAYFVRLTGLPPDQAWALQKKYLNDYGTAVPGLVQHHGVDPHDFMADVHDVPTDSLTPDPALRRAIARLPGRKLVFTNGSAWHAERVLKKLNLADLFDEVFHAEASNLIPKPDPPRLRRPDRRPRRHARDHRLLRGPGGQSGRGRPAGHDHGAGGRAGPSLDRAFRAL